LNFHLITLYTKEPKETIRILWWRWWGW